MDGSKPAVELGPGIDDPSGMLFATRLALGLRVLEAIRVGLAEDMKERAAMRSTKHPRL